MTGRLVALLAAVVAAVGTLAAFTYEPAGAAPGDRLPDLRMAPIDNFRIVREEGRERLRFDTVIVNVGAGDFEAHGQRSSTGTPTMRVHQHIFNSAGDTRDVATKAQMYYSGDGHDHWHLRNLAAYTLIKLKNKNKRVGRDGKEGFCFFDNVDFGSSAGPSYRGCANGQPGALSVRMGLSRGWGDLYGWRTVGQYIDITSLADGRYRVRAAADVGGWFMESSNKNNGTWADIRIEGSQVSVIRYGPSARPI
jgi:hypothetical protein